jgi:hypothetical protein
MRWDRLTTGPAAEGRTLERLGLRGMDGPQIRRVMDEGFG